MILLIALSDRPATLIFVLVASSDMQVLSVSVLGIAIVLFLLLIDITCHVTRNKGVFNKLVRCINKRRKYDKCKYAVTTLHKNKGAISRELIPVSAT